MTAARLQQISNPSELFLAERTNQVAGNAVFAGIEGSRPLLIEIEALVAPSSLASPRRNVVGGESSRLAMLTAVLEARCGLPLSGRDIFLNVAGGMKIQEPAADLAVAAALISSVTTRPLPSRSVFFGEVALCANVLSLGFGFPTQAPKRLDQILEIKIKCCGIKTKLLGSVF